MDIKELYKLYQQHQCITTDSRDCPEGSIFLALKGESFNGLTASNQAHFQMIYRQIWILVLFKHPLCKKRLTRM